MTQKQYKPHFEHLKNKWTQKQNFLQKVLWEKHQESLDWLHHTSKQLMAGSVASVMLLTHPGPSNIIAQNIVPPSEPHGDKKENNTPHTKEQLIADLKSLLPAEVQPLTSEQEQQISMKLMEYFKVPAYATYQGKRLNTSYGIIGAEQHLMRYPGDTMDTHFDTPDEAKYYSSGMAPGRGAWGYFADSRESMTEQDKQREKYYIAAQTFLAPGWDENVNEYYNFFKYRKMLIVNPENGKAIVAVIGDAGPAKFTGKHLGGSPEVMAHLERKDGGQKGPVLYFFIDDPENKIPLGPISIH